MEEGWGFVWIMFALKIPLAMLLGIVWWAVRAEPDAFEDGDDDGGIGHRPDGPRRRGPRRRGPHGDPVIPSPPRTRTTARAPRRVHR